MNLSGIVRSAFQHRPNYVVPAFDGRLGSKPSFHAYCYGREKRYRCTPDLGSRLRGNDVGQGWGLLDPAGAKAASTCAFKALIKAVSSGATPSGAVNKRSA